MPAAASTAAAAGGGSADVDGAAHALAGVSLAGGAALGGSPASPRGPALNRNKYKTRLCRNFLQGSCLFGDSCSFAHGPQELQAMPAAAFKTRLCRHFEASGSCPYEERCGFAHGQAQLNTPSTAPPRPPVMRPPPFMYGPPAYLPRRGPQQELIKTRLCKHFSATGSCPFEGRCLFAHGERDLRNRGPPLPSLGPLPLRQPMSMMPVTPTSPAHWSPGHWGRGFPSVPF